MGLFCSGQWPLVPAASASTQIMCILGINLAGYGDQRANSPCGTILAEAAGPIHCVSSNELPGKE